MLFNAEAQRTQRKRRERMFEGRWRDHFGAWVASGAGSGDGISGSSGGRTGVGDEEGFAVGAEARGLAGEVSGGRRVRRVPRVQLGRVNGFVYFGLGVHDGFVW